MTYSARLKRNEREVQRLYKLARQLVLLPNKSRFLDPGRTLHLGFGRRSYTKLDMTLDTIADEYGYRDWFEFVGAAEQGDDIDASRQRRLQPFFDGTRQGYRYGSLSACARVTGTADDGTFIFTKTSHAVRDLYLPITERWIGERVEEEIHWIVCDTCKAWVTGMYNVKHDRLSLVILNPRSLKK